MARSYVIPSRNHLRCGGDLRMRKILGATGLAAVALVVAACGSSGGTTAVSSGSGSGSPPAAAASSPAPASSDPSSPASSSAAGGPLATKTINGKVVLTNSAGLTLYWFVPDTSTTSKCTGTCATYWPPVPGPATAGAGVTGKLGTITRSGGSLQATYDGHPLYTYAGDTAPGQAKGNGVNASGGVWHEMTASAPAAPAAPAAQPTTQAPAAPAPATSSSSSSSGGGYGY
jgi:predicted lipoprotein with Yx(FWY)xxD motif